MSWNRVRLVYSRTYRPTADPTPTKDATVCTSDGNRITTIPRRGASSRKGASSLLGYGMSADCARGDDDDQDDSRREQHCTKVMGASSR